MESGEYKGYKYAFGAFELDKVPEGFLGVDLDFVASPRHVLACIRTAVDSYLAGKSIARDLVVEFLVRLTGERQISRALKARKEKGKVLLVWLAKEEPRLPEKVREIEVPVRPWELEALERRLLLRD